MGSDTPFYETAASKFVPVATGNWGCGMFGGEKQPYSGWLPPELAEMSSTSLLTMRT